MNGESDRRADSTDRFYARAFDAQLKTVPA
jgi:hypothetical protein